METLKEGRTSLVFTRSDGSRTSTRSLELTVKPVYIQIVGQSYRAFADGSTNARRTDGNHEPWSMYYNVPKDRFDPALYEELLAPQYTAVRKGTTVEVDWFDADEDGLYVARWGNDPDALPGAYQLTFTPKADIYAGGMYYVMRDVRVEAPLSLSYGSIFAGENRYYMPDRGEGMSLESSGTGTMNLGDPSRLKLCIGYPSGGYGVGSGYVACPYDWVPSSGGGNLLVLKPSYEEIVRNFPAPYRFRGRELRVFARITNARSGNHFDFCLSPVEIWLSLAVTSRLESWASHSGWDITEEDHPFLVPCLYSEDFSPGMITFNASQAGGGGNLSEPPYYIPRTILTGIPDYASLDTRILLSETIPSHLPYPGYLEWQLSDRNTGLRCPDITNWLWDEGGFSPDDYQRDAYQSLLDRAGSWYHRKLYWRLCQPGTGTVLPEGGHLDIQSYGGVSDNYYLRIYDYASPLRLSDFDE